jgi:Ran GTPase-activating protein (RanGAP) involved in mRNA processing and transport
MNKTLQKLDLSNNIIGDKGCQLLCESIREHPLLTILNISYNKIGDQGAIKIARLLEF